MLSILNYTKLNTSIHDNKRIKKQPTVINSAGCLGEL